MRRSLYRLLIISSVPILLLSAVSCSGTHGRTATADTNDLGSVFDAHVKHEFVEHDVEATMRTMAPQPDLLHLPTLAGGRGVDQVRSFYGTYFVGKWPADTKVEQVSRTVGREQVVDELLVSFTHDIRLDFMLPGIPPTGKRVEMPVVVVMKFADGKIAYEHIYWDQASLLVQVGLLDPKLLPAIGVEQAKALRDPSFPLNPFLKLPTP
ncbi:MAG: nuclear transport factor 2 family protein [Nitrospirae bacterium]|nr:MAG: nuclear transport factor 2 family protein [Nitrospirota bacterium]